MTNQTNWKELTQETLKEILHYDPDTGIFTWLISKGTAKKGNVAGNICNQRGKKYRTIMINYKTYYAHRLAWLYVYGEFPEKDTDHINGDGLYNRIDNLRCVTESENLRNSKLSSRNKSGVIGVSWEKLVSKWRVKIGVQGKNICLGFFRDLDEAIKVRKAAEIKYEYHPNHGSIRTL